MNENRAMEAGRDASTLPYAVSLTPVVPGNLMNALTRPILIVEDHLPTTKVLVRLVEARGFKVLTAHSLAEARALAAKHDVGFLISDLGLPDGNGGDLMKELHDRLGISGVAVTGYGMDADIAHARERGFALHLTKPIQIGDLEKVLVLAKAELTRPSLRRTVP